MIPYPEPQVRFQLQKGQLSFQGFDVSAQALGLFFLPHSAQHRQQKLWATTLPSKLLSHSGIEIWLLDGKQKTLMLTTTPKSASAALGTFPRVSRTGRTLWWQQHFLPDSPLWLFRDTGMVKGILTPSLSSVFCRDGLVKKSLPGRSQWHREGSGWKFHTGNRNLTVEYCNRFKQQQKNLLWLQMFRSFQSIYKARVGKPDWLWFGVSV